MGTEKLLPLTAIAVLLVASFSSLYVYAAQTDSDFITINGSDYTLDQLFFMGEETILMSNDAEFTGILLSDLMIKVGIANPDDHTYTLIAADNYEKTVQWGHMQTGVLTEDGMSVFSDLPKAFRVKDIVRIEVND